MKQYICFDVGGTGIKYGIIEENGNILEKGSMDSEARTFGGPGIVNKMIKKAKDYSSRYELSGLAISSHGMIDSKNGIVMHADDHLIPGYSGMKVKEIIERETGLTCEIENDVNAAGLGELWLGDDTDSRLVSMITVGTGIGACLIQDGHLINGECMCAGEIGKIVIPGGRFEDLASAYAMTSGLEKKLGLEPDSLDGKMVFEKIQAGDQVYIDAVDVMIDKLAIGLSTLAYIYNPGIIILGGGIMARDDYFRPRLETAMAKYLTPLILDHTEIRFAKLKNDAGMIGALRNFLNKN
nr:ROK family protein [uncultured Peptostreptococcus sp.]